MCDTVLRVGSSPCCSWDADKRWRMLKTKDILESTRVPDPTAHYYGETQLDMASSYPTAIIEMNERSQDMSGNARKRKMYQAYKGQLKLSVSVNYGNLTVHVAQARHLICKSKATCDTFVKVSMVPNPSERTTCMTTLIPDTNHPVYDEKITYELLGCDYERRLQISVYHFDCTTNTNELIGCMSFGIKNIARKKTTVSGWYYLLAEKLGSYKHMMVKEDPVSAACTDPVLSDSESSHRPLKRCRQNSHGSTGSSSNGSMETGDLCESADLSVIKPVPVRTPPVMQVLTIPVINRRSRPGYGFTLVDGHPAKVSKIEFSSPAHLSGLCEGDQVIKVNGQSVHNMYPESVGRIIKHYPKCVILEVLRCVGNVPENIAVSVRSKFLKRVSKETDDYSSDEDEAYYGHSYGQNINLPRGAHKISGKAALRVEPLGHCNKIKRDIVPLVALDANHNNIYK